MLKSNSKKAIENIKATVNEEIIAFLEEREITTDKPATAYFEIVKVEKFYNHYNSDFAMFKEWLQGLGGMFFSSHVFLNDAKAIIRNWLEETEEETSKYSREQAEELAIHLFYRELQKMIAKESKF